MLVKILLCSRSLPLHPHVVLRVVGIVERVDVSRARVLRGALGIKTHQVPQEPLHRPLHSDPICLRELLPRHLIRRFGPWFLFPVVFTR